MDGPRLLIRIRPSRRLRTALLAGLCLALAAPWISDLPVWLCAWVDACALLLAHRAFGSLAPRDTVELQVDERGWTLREGSVSEAVELLPDSTVWPALIVLRFASARGNLELVLLQDSADTGDLRRLRAALRLRSGRSGNEDRVDRPV